MATIKRVRGGEGGRSKAKKEWSVEGPQPSGKKRSSFVATQIEKGRA